MKNSPNIGIDLIEVSRFKKLDKKAKGAFLSKIFTKKEIAYCLSHAEPAVHLAGIFAAKEAMSKAAGTKRYPLIEIEIRHDKVGAPEAWHKGRKMRGQISITHTRSLAAAVALSSELF
jgi:holo-[acyl-carrier protein] synthase